MEIWDYILNKDFSSLKEFEFEELREIINLCDYYVRDENWPSFESEANHLKEKYQKELKRINDYEQNEYLKTIEEGGVPNDESAFMIGKLESETIGEFVRLIEKYFDVDTFNKYKNQLPHSKVQMTMLDEDKNELSKALVSIRQWTYHFLNTIGYYSSKKHYFIKRRDVNKVCGIYTKEVVFVNQLSGIKDNIYLLGPWGRLENYGKNLIDVDYISLQALILPYLNTNTKILVNICEKIRKGFHNKVPWYCIKDEIGKYVKECEISGLMKKVE